MNNLGITELPLGVSFKSMGKRKHEGFRVILPNFPERMFVSRNMSLIEKLKRAMEYLDIIIQNDEQRLKKFEEDRYIEKKYYSSKGQKKYSPDVLNVMNNVGITDLPIFIRYNKQYKRFFWDDKKSYKSFHANTLEDSLKLALKYSEWKRTSA